MVATFLGLHAVLASYAGSAGDCVDEVIRTILPAVAAESLADAVDAYAEPIAFSEAQARRFFAAATAFGLPAKFMPTSFRMAAEQRLRRLSRRCQRIM